MPKIRVAKLVTIAIPCVVLAIGLGAQALSSVATRSAPEQAVALFPANGLAQEQLAFRVFQEEVSEGATLEEAARAAARIARKGLRHDPLAPKSYAVLAMAEKDPERRSEILRYANQLNRRDISLQGLVLQEHLENNDYAGIVETLDRILRVHPNYHSDFFPVLLNALKMDEAVPLFPGILNGESDWHESFLLFAVRDPEARPNLAMIRADIPIENERFDRQLINGLAAQGDLETAYSLYENVRVPSAGEQSSGLLAWTADFPPFDWALTGERDFRSQPSRDGRELELYARTGQGGVIARRIVSAADGPIRIGTTLTMGTGGRADGVRLILRCGAAAEVIYDEPLSRGENNILIAERPEGCRQFMIEISARSLRGEPTLRAELSRLSIKPAG